MTKLRSDSPLIRETEHCERTDALTVFLKQQDEGNVEAVLDLCREIAYRRGLDKYWQDVHNAQKTA